MADTAVSLSAERIGPRLRAEVNALLADQYEHTDAKDGIPPYAFMWDMYEFMQEQDQVLVFTARSDDRLVGFLMYVVCEAPHHKGTRFAECDSLVTSWRERGKGIGRGLVDYALPVLTALGVDRVIHRYRRVYDTTPLFEKLGFKAEETVYTKRL